MRSLALKLILAFLAISLTGTLLVSLLAGWRTAGEFSQFIIEQEQEILIEELAAYYQQAGSWRNVQNQRFSAHMGMRGMGAMHGSPLGAFTLADANGRVLIAGPGYRPAMQLSPAALRQGQPIRVEGEVVGALLINRMMASSMTAPAQQFLNRVYRALILGGLGATAVALLLGVLLARTLTKPLQELTQATRAVAQGQFDQQVPVRSADELGDLARSFNQMSAGLKEAQAARRQLTADIAHDLRTPLSIILGHTEALRDGVLPASGETFTILHEEAVRLNRLVDDLRTLSLAEAGELPLVRRPTSPRQLLAHAAAAHANRAQQQQVVIQTAVPPRLPPVDADPDRIGQVLSNLLDNALRHTPAHGRIDLTASRRDDWVRLQISDSGPGIAATDLPHIFERFYRADKSRSRQNSGGSGLGLAIARSIIAAHHGRIWVESDAGQGAHFIIELPAAAHSK